MMTRKCHFAEMKLHYLGHIIDGDGVDIDPASIWASSGQNLSFGFPSKRDSNHSPQLQRIAKILKICLKQV